VKVHEPYQMLGFFGNVRQWLIAGVGGKPDIRDRDSEFNAQAGPAKAELVASLRAIVEEACKVIEPLTPERLTERVLVQKYEVTAPEGIYHVVEHFAQHAGQIIFATKR
jgi:uncharacterized damage-inducible protein DinB